MADEQYELEVLLELREKARDDAQDALSKANIEVQRAKKALQQAIATLESAKITRKNRCDLFDNRYARGEVSIGEVQQFNDFVRGLEQREEELASDVERERERARKRERAAARAREALGEAVRELEAVESHRRSWQEEQDLVANRREGVAMDEIAARIWREQQ